MIDDKGRLRLSTEWAQYFGAPEAAELHAINPSTPEEQGREVFSGHEFRIVSLAQLRENGAELAVATVDTAIGDDGIPPKHPGSADKVAYQQLPQRA